ncbi:uncharacterized protein LOC126202921 isoform X2 [Schistocerca nitens]|uniref:uncharacterized protein LOC126202921 isoform X2 n=1 Tax=Schistocerca nitens TaxID=7011 RepID=UPI00211852B8|nr:uncharacterized protein LOC126202921 isoform X2 [Schistocerca nitens]
MAATTLLWQVVMLAVAGAHAQFDLPYPLQLVRAAPSAVSPQLYGPQPEAVSLIRGSTQPGDSPQQAPAEEEMTQFHSQDAAGRSLFGYMMADQARIEARAPDGSVRGSYTYLDPSGRAIKVQYWDEGQGFHAAGNHLPASYPGLPQPVRDTPEVEAARKQHLQAYQQVLRRQLQLLYQQQQLQEQQQQQQQQVYQPPSGGGGDSEVVVVESDPAAPPTDYAEDDPGQRYPSLPLVAALYDPSHVHDVGRDAVIVDSAAARQPQQGSTIGDRQNSTDSSEALVNSGGDVVGHDADSAQRFIIVYADSATGDNTISENDDEKPSAKHVRSALQNTSTSDVAARQNHTATATRRARRGRVTIYDYIKERDPEKMARNFPESYLIQEIFNSSRALRRNDDDTDDLQRAAEREFQFLHKTGGAKSRGRSMLAADVVTSDSGNRRKTFYKAGVVLPDLSYPTRHSGVSETSRQEGGAAFPGGEPITNRGFSTSYNGNRGTYRPQFTYVENRGIDTSRKGQSGLSHRYDDRPLVSTEGEISRNYSVSSVNSASQDSPHPVYYPPTNSYSNQTQAAVHVVYNEAGRSNEHRKHSSLPGVSPLNPQQEGNLGAYDPRHFQEPYNHQQLPSDAYSRPQEHSRSRYVPHPVYYNGNSYSDVNETQVAVHVAYNEAGRSNEHRKQSSLPGVSPLNPQQEGNLRAYDLRHFQEPYNHQQLPSDTYSRPQEHSRSRYVPHPVYYNGNSYSDVNETQVALDSSFNGTDNDGNGGQYQLFDDSSVASSHFGTMVTTQRRNNERVPTRNYFPEGRMPVVVGDDVAYSTPHNKYGALFYKVDSDGDGSRGTDSDHSIFRVSSQTVAPPHVSGGFYSKGSSAHSDQPTHYGGHPSGVTNVGGYPPVAMQYLQDIARRADTPVYRQAGSKEAVILNNLIGRSASSKARSLEAPAGEAGKVADPEGGSGASKEELVAETVAAGSSRDEHATAAETEAGEANRATPGNQRSVVSLKDGAAESYSAMYIHPGRQAKAASPKAAAMPQPQVDGGFFYSFHHPVIPVAVQVAQPVAADAADAGAAADAKAPPRGLSVSQRASLYDAVPVAAVHDAQVPPYLRGAITDHQTKPVFIHYDPADAAAAR